MTHREAFRLFRGTFLRYLGLFLLATLIFAVAGLFTGHIEKHLINAFGPAVLILMVMIAGSLATHNSARILIEDYENSYSFKRDKAYRVFYRLLREGERYIRGNQSGRDRRTKWDLEVQRTLATHCIDEKLNTYLRNTGKRQDSVSPLEAEYVTYAIGFVRELLDRDFSWDKPSLK